jgi:integrase
MNSADLAATLEVLAQALRLVPELQALQGSMPGAQAALAALPAAPVSAALPALPAPVVPQKTLNEWLDLHEQQLRERGYTDQTLKNRGANLKHVRRMWGDSVISELKPHQVATALRKGFDPKKTSTAGRVLAELREAYTEAIANGWCENNPAFHIKPPKHSTMRARLTLGVWRQMLELSKASPQRWVRPMLLLAMVIGQRRADLGRVCLQDIVTGDDGKQYLRIEQQKKAGKRIGARVEIPLSLRMEAIDMSVGDVIELCRECGSPGPALLRSAGGKRLEVSSLSARFHEHILVVLGEDAFDAYEWPSLHEVRSLCARTYHAQGYSKKTLQVLLGHKNSEMTDLYIDDRGLSDEEWKRVALFEVPPAKAAAL